MFSSIATDLFQKSVTNPDQIITTRAEFALSRLASRPLALAMTVSQIPHWSFDFIRPADRAQRIRSAIIMTEKYSIAPETLLYAEQLLNIFINPRTSSLSEFGLEFLSRALEPLAPSTLLRKEILVQAALENGFSYEHVEAVFFGIFQMRNASKYTIQSAFLSNHQACSLTAWERLCKIAKADGTAATVRLLNEAPEHKALLWVDPKRMLRIEGMCLRAHPHDLGPVLFQSLPDSLVAQWVRTHGQAMGSEDARASIFQVAVQKGALCTLEEVSPSLPASSYAAITRRSRDFSIPATTLIETEILLSHCHPFGLFPEMSLWVDFISRKGLTAEQSLVDKVTLAALQAKNQDPSLFPDREGWISLSTRSHSLCASPLVMSTRIESQEPLEQLLVEPASTDFSATVVDCSPSALCFSTVNPVIETPCAIVNAWSPQNGCALELFSKEKAPRSGEKKSQARTVQPSVHTPEKAIPRYTILKRPMNK